MNISLMDSGEVLEKALRGERLFPEEAIYLCREAPLLDLAAAAGELVRRANPSGQVGYTVNRTVVYSNVCGPQCPFCRGTVTRDDPKAFTLTAEEVVDQVGAAVAAGATQIILQGGHRSDLPWNYYVLMVQAVKACYPHVQLVGFSPTEIMHFNMTYQKTTHQVMTELREAGLDAVLAGGSPSLSTRVPEYRTLLRGPWNPWFDVVHRCADLGIPMVAPFVFGLGESSRERVGYLYRVRAVQERTGAKVGPVFRSLAVFNLADGEGTEPVSGQEYLRMVALARLLVPNIPRVAADFLYQGAKVAQVALDAGADSMDGTFQEYDQVQLAAGRVGAMTAAEMERLIQDAGRKPVKLAGLY